MADARRRRVLMASPGGRRGRGGMASLVVYLADALPKRLPNLDIEIVDSYGPGAFWAMPFHFARAALKVLWACLFRRIDLLHLHMSHYGSVTRKLALAAIAQALGVPVVVHLHGSDFLPDALKQSGIEVEEHLDRDLLPEVPRSSANHRRPGSPPETLPAFVPLAEDGVCEAQSGQGVLAGHPWLQFQHPLGFHDVRPR